MFNISKRILQIPFKLSEIRKVNVSTDLRVPLSFNIFRVAPSQLCLKMTDYYFTTEPIISWTPVYNHYDNKGLK